MENNLEIEFKFNLIIQNLEEIIGDTQDIKTIIKERPLKIYFGTAPTNTIHIGYFVPLLKIADFVDAGCDVTILLADLHAILDNLKSSFETINKRSEYYEIMLLEMLKLLNVDTNKIKFVRGTKFQLGEKYTLDMYKAHTLVNVNEA